jgi:20S proteasome subunit alpha 6
MHSGLYDKDCTTWNPSGEIPQISFVKEAVLNGTCIVALRSKQFSVLGGFKKTQQTDFSTHVEKVFKIDDHCGIAISGLTADARVLAEYMRMECLNHKYVFDGPMNVGRLVAQIGDKAHDKTLWSGKRPYGVGLLVQGWEEDQQRATVYETSPTGDYFEYIAFSIGDRSQPARTYLERHFESFYDTQGQEALIKHAVTALHAAFKQDTEMTTQNIDISIVGKDQPWKKLTPDELRPYVDAVRAASGDAPAAMDTSA